MEFVPEIAVLAVMVFVLALAQSGKQITESLQSAMANVPIIGRAIAAILSPIPHALAWVAGKLEHGIDALVGLMWNQLASMVAWLFRELVGTASIVAHLAAVVGQSLYANTGLKAIVHQLVRAYHWIAPQVKHLVWQEHQHEKRLKHLEHTIGPGIGEDVLPRLKWLETEWGRFKHKRLPAIEAGIEAIPGELEDAAQWTRDNFVPLAKQGLAAAVLTALGYLGLGGLNCNSLKSSLGRRGCGLWSGLEDLLGLFVDVVAFTNACAVVEFLSPIVSTVAAPVVAALSSVGAGICHGGIGAPDDLTVPALHLPASSGVTLHVP